MSHPHHHHDNGDIVTGLGCGTVSASSSSIASPTITINLPQTQPTGRVVAGGRGSHAFILDADGIRDWALIHRDYRPDQIRSIGAEDRIGVLNAKRIRLSGRVGRIEIRDHRHRLSGIIRDRDITLAEARQMVFALPQGWPV